MTRPTRGTASTEARHRRSVVTSRRRIHAACNVTLPALALLPSYGVDMETFGRCGPDSKKSAQRKYKLHAAVLRVTCLRIHTTLCSHFHSTMATPVIVGLGAVTAALVGRHLIRSGVIGKGAAEQWVKGGFRAKMDRKEAIAILGLKCVVLCPVVSQFLILELAEMGLRFGIDSRMPTVKSCWPTIPIEAVPLTSRVKLTKQKTCLTRWTGNDDVALHLSFW